ncbi:sortase B [Lachnospiraceae bacterium XBD2001]|nr:sortase B [Lachnospiraceae bacterium XBD2001]
MKRIWEILAMVVLAACVIAAGAIGFSKYRQHQNQLHMEELQQMTRIISDIDVEIPEEEEVVIPIDFEAAWKENEDIIAWLEVPETEVNYPILQSKPDMEEDFYLEHNLDGSGGYPGCIYIQKSNDADFSDAVTVVYGHNMKNGSMFAGLHSYENREFFDTNDEFYIYTPTTAQTYHVIAAVNYDDRLIPAVYNYFASDVDVSRFLGDIYAFGEGTKNHLDTEVQLDPSMHYVVLSTCTANSSSRWLVIGVLEKNRI